MPVRFQKECESGAHVLVWEAIEDENTLLSLLPSAMLTDAEYAGTLLLQKRKEILASRASIQYLANYLNVQYDGIKKDENGKPFLVNCLWEISITHSRNFMAVIFHPEKPVGIDIERPSNKLIKVQPRLFTSIEIDDMQQDVNNMTIYWSAKEALYKLYGKRGTDFKKNLKIHRNADRLMGEISMPDYQQIHSISVEQIGEYFLVWVV